MFGFGKKPPRWRKVTVLDLKTIRPIKTAAAAAAGFRELLDAAGYFPGDKFMRSETVRDFRDGLREQAPELKSHIETLMDQLRDLVEQRTMLQEDIEDHQDDSAVVARLSRRLEELQPKLPPLRADITGYTIELAEFKADRADFVVAMANHTFGHERKDPRISRRLNEL